MGYETYRPEWTPEGAGGEFAGRVMTGVSGEELRAAAKASPQAPHPAPKKLSVEDYVEGILAGNRMVIAKAITIVESNAPKHFALGQEIIQRILPHTGNATRVGVTGVPGAGKSTFIEALGTRLCKAGRRVAVLAVDPSSSVSRGSILGDKTRMENLVKEPNAFIRPSPSGGTLGGVSRKSRETLLICEAAGYDVILVETVGVGQGETTVRSMVDFFLYIVLTGAGDDLQGIKKGIMELADAILVNKADGDNRQRALVARADYEQILHYLRPATEGWQTKAYLSSSVTGEGIGEIWEVVERFERQMRESGQLSSRRQQQTLDWVKSMAEESIKSTIYQNPGVVGCLARMREQIMGDRISATLAAQELIEAMERALRA